MASQSGIADLIGRLKKDGVDAGEAEKQRLTDEANQKAEQIIADAKQQAADLLTGAKQERDKLKAQLDAELKMAARDFSMRMGDRIKSQVIMPVVAGAAKDVLSDAEFLKKAVHEVCVAVAKDGAGVDVVVSPEMKQSLEAYFTGELAKALKGGDVSVSDESGLIGFRISPRGEGFAWDFTSDSVTQELSTLVDPALRAYFAVDGKKAGAGQNGSATRASA
jgi:V/A-type H+-transporting ATPase subunit E